MSESPLAALPMREAFQTRVRAAGAEFDSLPADTAIRLMLDWYVEERFPGCDVSESGDMLLFQWGASGIDGEFYVDVTRQLMTGDCEDEDIYQLRLTLTFEVPANSLGIESGNRWCETPAGIEEFRAFIESSEALSAVRNHPPVQVELDYGSV